MSTEKRYYNPELWGGIECTINRCGDAFFDQLEYAGHYDRKDDLHTLAGLGIRKLRYPILWERHQPEMNSAPDWSWIQGQLRILESHGIDVIAGLVHHGSGPAFTSLSDPRFPELLAAYAGKVAEAFPHIRYYTPVNEPLTTARFSGLYGIWYPHQRDARAFMQMLLHELKGTVLGMQAIRKINPQAKLVQTEDLGKTYSTATLQYQAAFENERRWLTFDLLHGRFNEGHPLWNYVRSLQIPEADLRFFIEHPCPPDIIGWNHYLTSERYIDERLEAYPQHTHGGNGKHRYADVEAIRVDLEEPSGIRVLLQEAWERYRQPMAITEIHLHCHREEQLRWFRYVRDAALALIQEGVDIKAVTSWALLGSYGWNKLLTQPRGEYEPGAFDLRGGKPRPTALAGYIQSLSRADSGHHLAEGQGWWQRSSRILYGPVIRDLYSPASYEAQKPLLIIGKNGTLGQAFARVCEDRCIPYRLISRQDCDISEPGQVKEMIAHYRPWAIVNAAGFVRVDEAETESAACYRDNTEGPVNLAYACNEAGVRLVNFSSDLVFDGEKHAPYVESDPVHPLNIYGQSKALCERRTLEACPGSMVIRTSAFFGPWDSYNFAHFVRKSLAQGSPFTATADQYISPTYVPHLVHHVLDLLIDGESGCWHLANAGGLSWSEFAYRIAEGFRLDRKLIQAVPAAQLPLPAKRPSYSVLGSERGSIMPGLDSALDQYFRTEREEKRKVA